MFSWGIFTNTHRLVMQPTFFFSILSGWSKVVLLKTSCFSRLVLFWYFGYLRVDVSCKIFLCLCLWYFCIAGLQFHGLMIKRKPEELTIIFFFFNYQCPLPVCLLFSIFQPFYIVLYIMSMGFSCTYYEKEEKLCLFHLARSKILYSIFFFLLVAPYCLLDPVK